MKRKIRTYGGYFEAFMETLKEKEQEKIQYGLLLLKSQDRLPKKFVKLVRDGIYELRTEYGGNIYRVFFIFDEGEIVVLFNGFQKKTQKTPQNEIEKAIKIKEAYYADKQSQNRCVLDAKFGKEGTPERARAEEAAYSFYSGQILQDARKEAKMTQSELAERTQTTKSYISKIENGVITPSVGVFYRIIAALGMRVEVVKPVY